MSKQYSKEDLKIKVEVASENMSTFYTRPFINHTGKTKDDNSLFNCEFISGLIHKEWFDKIGVVHRRQGYFEDSHTAENRFSNSNREEEKIAMFYFANCRKGDVIGKIIDYQTPLKGKRKDGVGKVDLLSIDENKNVLFLELKKPESKETLLRCVVEAFSYTKFVDQDVFRKDFKEKAQCDYNKIIPCALFFKNSRPYEDYERIIAGKFQNMKTLIDALGVRLYCIKELSQIGKERFFESELLSID